MCKYLFTERHDSACIASQVANRTVELALVRMSVICKLAKISVGYIGTPEILAADPRVRVRVRVRPQIDNHWVSRLPPEPQPPHRVRSPKQHS